MADDYAAKRESWDRIMKIMKDALKDHKIQIVYKTQAPRQGYGGYPYEGPKHDVIIYDYISLF